MNIFYYFEERELDYCLIGRTICSTISAINPLDAYDFYKTMSKNNPDFEFKIVFRNKRGEIK